MALLKENCTAQLMELEYIDCKMKEMYNKYGHLVMVFDYTYEKTPDLLKKKGYEVKLKTSGENLQIIVTNKGTESIQK